MRNITGRSSTPDFLVGVEDGHEVLVPIDTWPSEGTGPDDTGVGTVGGDGGGGSGAGIPIPANNSGNDIEVQVPPLSDGRIYLRANTQVGGDLGVSGQATVNRLSIPASGVIETRSSNRFSIVANRRLQLYGGGGPDAPVLWGGDVRLFGGDGDQGYFGGNIQLIAGDAADTRGGDILIQTGYSNTANGNLKESSMTLQSETGVFVNTQHVRVNGSLQVFGTSNSNHPRDIELYAGSTTDNQFFYGEGNQTGPSGKVVISAGGSDMGHSLGNNGIDGGSVEIYGGNTAGVGTKGGDVTIRAGYSGRSNSNEGQPGFPGTLYLQAGNGDYVNATGSRATMMPLNGTNGGDALIEGGGGVYNPTQYPNAGGKVILRGGSSDYNTVAAGFGGDIVLQPGTGHTNPGFPGAHGDVVLIFGGTTSGRIKIDHSGAPGAFLGTVTHPTANAGPGANITIRGWIPAQLNGVYGWIPFYAA